MAQCLQDVAGNGLVFPFGELQAQLLPRFVDAHAALNPHRRLINPLELLLGLGQLIGDPAHHLFDELL